MVISMGQCKSVFKQIRFFVILLQMKNKTHTNPQDTLLQQAACTKEVKASRQQLMKLRNMIQRQYSIFLSQTVSQDLMLERIINKLTIVPQLALKTDSKGADWHSAIHFCIQEMKVMLEGHERERIGWQMIMKKLLEQNAIGIHPELQAQQCNEELFDLYPVELDDQMCGRMTSLQQLEAQVEKLDRKYEEILQQNKNIKQQYNNLSALYSQSTRKNQQFQYKLRQLSEQKTILMKQLNSSINEIKQYRQSTHRTFANQFELGKIIDENEREICRVHEEVHRLNLQIVSFQLKFKEIVEREGKQKITTAYRLKRQDSKILSEIPTQNTIGSIQSKASKRQLQKIRKFNLQSVQEMLSSYYLLG